MKKITFAVLWSLFAVAVSPALANPVASASITGYGYELVDLKPDDGIAPSISFGLSEVWLRSNADDNSGSYMEQVGFNTDSTEVEDAYGFARSDFGADGATAVASRSRNLYAASSIFKQDFVLSPFTQVIFTATGSAAVDASDPGFAVAQIFAEYLDGIYMTYFSNEVSTNNGLTNPHLVLSVTAGATELSGETGFFAWALSGSTEAVAVPEPSTSTILIAGLGILGFLRRKRQSQVE